MDIHQFPVGHSRRQLYPTQSLENGWAPPKSRLRCQEQILPEIARSLLVSRAPLRSGQSGESLPGLTGPGAAKVLLEPGLGPKSKAINRKASINDTRYPDQAAPSEGVAVSPAYFHYLR